MRRSWRAPRTIRNTRSCSPVDPCRGASQGIRPPDCRFRVAARFILAGRRSQPRARTAPARCLHHRPARWICPRRTRDPGPIRSAGARCRRVRPRPRHLPTADGYRRRIDRHHCRGRFRTHAWGHPAAGGRCRRRADVLPACVSLRHPARIQPRTWPRRSTAKSSCWTTAPMSRPLSNCRREALDAAMHTLRSGIAIAPDLYAGGDTGEGGARRRSHRPNSSTVSISRARSATSRSRRNA